MRNLHHNRQKKERVYLSSFIFAPLSSFALQKKIYRDLFLFHCLSFSTTETNKILIRLQDQPCQIINTSVQS